MLPVLRDINLVVQAGEMLGITGSSGAGKSTLLHILGTLERPSGGNLTFHGASLLDRSNGELTELRNRHLGFIFQLHYLLPEFTVLENIMMPALIGRAVATQARRTAAEVAEYVGLSQRLRHRAGELSGGEQQRVAIARALMNRPELVLADEPTGDLDSTTGGAICELLRRFNRQFGQTFIVVTHNHQLAASLDRVVELKDGRLVTDGEDCKHV
ncbi:MAG: ABC transporter ATP-binding protein [Candidatus Tectomicrobia bacterium]|nr:ABC transporter ATP-binding protein [Candidatus Tectomicrobia bacterium]